MVPPIKFGRSAVVGSHRWLQSLSKDSQRLAYNTSALQLPACTTGLENLGNTFYMKVALQVRVHSVLFVISGLRQENINSISVTHDDIAEEVVRRLVVIWSQRFRVLSPQMFRGAVGAHLR